jgi:apolipoprotein N-acyltransferase
VDASLQWTVDVFERTLRELGDLSMRGRSEAPPALVIWPESPSPFYENDPKFRSAISQLARDAKAHLIIGTLGVRTASEHGRQVRDQSEVFNSASLITPAGEWQARYDKIHLVPFGEYIPFPVAAYLRGEAHAPGRRLRPRCHAWAVHRQRAADRRIHLLRIGVPR